MFVGEMCCMVVYFITLFVQRRQWKKRHPSGLSSDIKKVRSNEDGDQVSTTSQISVYPKPPKMNYFLFAAPAFCDVVAPSVQYLGLTLTSASSYQMLRGTKNISCLRKKNFFNVDLIK